MCAIVICNKKQWRWQLDLTCLPSRHQICGCPGGRSDGMLEDAGELTPHREYQLITRSSSRYFVQVTSASGCMVISIRAQSGTWTRLCAGKVLFRWLSRLVLSNTFVMIHCRFDQLPGSTNNVRGARTVRISSSGVQKRASK